MSQKKRPLLSRIDELSRSFGGYGYHFIHIPKNGGTAVRTALRKQKYVSMSRPYHHRYIDIVNSVGRDLRFFCIVRNPWSRTASRFVYAQQSSIKWRTDDPRRIYIRHATFEDYVRDQKLLAIPKQAGRPWMGPMNSWFDQLFWVTSESGEVVCDCLRMESLSHDLNAYFNSNILVPHKNVSAQSYDYRRMYTDELSEVVSQTFKKDISHFGFTFDGAAIRNIAIDGVS